MLGLLIGVNEILFLGALGLVIFGTSMLPSIGQRLGETIHDFKDSADGLLDDDGLPSNSEQDTLDSTDGTQEDE